MKPSKKLSDVLKNQAKTNLETIKQEPPKKEPPKKQQTDINSFSFGLNDYFSKYTFLIAIGLVVIISIIAFKDFIFLKKVFFFKDIGSDSVNVDYPMMKMAELMQKDNWYNSWSFYIGMGAPYSLGVFHPLNILSYFIIIISKFFNLIYSTEPALNRFSSFLRLFIFIVLGAYFYFRTIKVSHYSTIVGTILFSFLGFTIMACSWGHDWDVFVFILLMLSFEQLFIYKRWYFLPIAYMLFVGNVYYIYIYSFFLGLYSLFRFIQEQKWNSKEYFLLIAKIGGAAILGIFMNLINSYSEILTIITSPRVAGNSSYAEVLLNGNIANSFKLERITNILRFFSIDIMGNGSDYRGWYNYYEAAAFYSGLSCLLLIPQIFTSQKNKMKILYGIFISFWVAVIFIPQLRYAISLYVGDYYKRGIDMFISFIMVYISVQSLVKLEKTEKINPVVLFASLFILLLLLHFPYFSSGSNIVDTNIKMYATVFLIIHASIIYFLSVKEYKNYAMWAFIFVISLEALIFSSITINRRQAFTKEEFITEAGGFFDKSVDAVNYLKSIDNSFYRIEKDYSSGKGMHGSLNDAQVQGYFGTANYSSFNQKYFIHFLESAEIIKKGEETQSRWAIGLRTRILLQTMANVKYNLSKSDNPFLINSGYKQINQIGDVKILKNEYYIPFGFTYNHFIEEKDFLSAKILQKDLFLLRGFIIPENKASYYNSRFKKLTQADTITNFGFEQYRKFVDALKKDTFKITNFKHNNIKGEIYLDSAKMLFFSIPYDKGWEAIVNGKTIKPENINIGFMGLFLEKGNYKIELRYKPQYFNLVIWISIIASLLYIVLVFISLKVKFKYKLIGLGGISILYAIILLII